MTALIVFRDRGLSWAAPGNRVMPGQRLPGELQGALEYLMASTSADQLTFDQLSEIFGRYQTIWDDLSRTWLEHRREPAPSPQA